VKVIDFGLAKALEGRLTDRTAATRVGELLGTPAYMAPEQADPRRGEIGPATDVYALGVVLYELLSGVLPFDPERLRHDPVELARILREEEPRSLSSTWSSPLPDAEELARRRGTDVRSLRRLLRGELSWIVRKCLEKDPRRRYAGAQELSADVERHLTHRPLVARRPGPGRRLAKLLRRHPAAVAAASAAVVTLAAAAGLSLLRSAGEGSRVEQLTHSGLVRVAGISPSGRLVLYAEQSRGAAPSLWLLDRETGAVERLPDLSATALATENRFSRDEQSLYVDGRVGIGRNALYRLSRDDGGWRVVSDDAPEHPRLSPDEQRLVGVRSDRPNAESRLVLADAGGGPEKVIARRPLASPYAFTAWSPDGRAVALTAGTGGPAGQPVGVVEVDVATGRERPVGPQDWLYALAKVYLPGGEALLVVGQRRQDAGLTRHIYRVERDTGEVRQVGLAGLRPSGWSLGLSADGRTLAVCAGRFRAGVWLVPYGDTSRAREVGVATRSPHFLADGSLLYTGVEEDLWLRRAAGGTRLLARSVYDASPAPDGRTLVMTLVQHGTPHVFRTDADGRGAARLSHVPARETAVAPDGSYALFVAAADDLLWRVPITGGAPVLVSPRPAKFPAISPDGRSIVVLDALAEAGPQLRIIATDGSEERIVRLPPGSAVSPSGFRFSPDGTAIDHVRADEHGVGNVWRLPLDGGHAVRITSFTSEPMTGFDWSPDGHTLVCLRGGWQGDVHLVRGEW
jgi:Tol biopolymer transport system component